MINSIFSERSRNGVTLATTRFQSILLIRSVTSVRHAAVSVSDTAIPVTGGEIQEIQECLLFRRQIGMLASPFAPGDTVRRFPGQILARRSACGRSDWRLVSEDDFPFEKRNQEDEHMKREDTAFSLNQEEQ